MRNKLLSEKFYHSRTILDRIKNIIKIEGSLYLNILDAMCGTGIVGQFLYKKLNEKKIKFTLTFLDNDKEMLNKIPGGNKYHKVLADVCHTGLKSDLFTHILVRFAIHEIPLRKKIQAFREFYRLLKSNGQLVIIDLLPNEISQDTINKIDSLKSTLTGRNNHSYFMIKSEYIRYLKNVGFTSTRVVDSFSQKISTLMWYNSDQIDIKGLRKLNDEILSLPNNIKRLYKIKKINGNEVISYLPIGIISAFKFQKERG